MRFTGKNINILNKIKHISNIDYEKIVGKVTMTYRHCHLHVTNQSVIGCVIYFTSSKEEKNHFTFFFASDKIYNQHMTIFYKGIEYKIGFVGNMFYIDKILNVKTIMEGDDFFVKFMIKFAQFYIELLTQQEIDNIAIITDCTKMKDLYRCFNKSILERIKVDLRNDKNVISFIDILFKKIS